MKYYFTSESVTEGHPDKICDKISDKILDTALKVDSNSKMAVETTIKDDLVFIYGESKTKAILDYENIAKEVLKDIGYDNEFKFVIKVGNQSTEINDAVEKEKIAAGDQGIMFGYACNETNELMPLPIMLANKLSYELTKLRKDGIIKWLKPDGKTQVTVEYKDNKPFRIDTIVVSCSHEQNISNETIKDTIINKLIFKVIPNNLLDSETKYLINTSGAFTIYGPFGDSGTTGRKIICDTYGGMGRIGGGCFSSKDPSKVDRTGAYYARYVAKNIVAHNLADKCEIEVSYAIGLEDPLSIYIDTFNTNKVSIEEIYKYINENFNFKVQNMIEELDLKKPIYYETASYGHFGREEFTWEKIKM